MWVFAKAMDRRGSGGGGNKEIHTRMRFYSKLAQSKTQLGKEMDVGLRNKHMALCCIPFLYGHQGS